MVKAYFENIHQEIIDHIDRSQSQVKICVAWFTDFEIYSKVVDKQKQGVSIEVIVANHEFNKKSRVDFKEFLQHNGKIGYVGNLQDGARDKLMHNKFCIIDKKTIITGSYNWSYKARFNDENILIIDEEPDLANQFLDKFDKIKPKFGFAIKGNKVALLPIEKIIAKWDIPTSTKNDVSNHVKNITNKF